MVLGLLRQAEFRRLCQPATNAKGGVRDSDESTLWQAYRPACDAGLPCHLWIEDGEVTALGVGPAYQTHSHILDCGKNGRIFSFAVIA
jgi:hypothetical protein